MDRAIFISYRRSDSEGEAGRLSDVLIQRFSHQTVFMDVDAIKPGRDFRKAIEESIESCAVLLTVIGPDWLEARAASGLRRLDEPNDYVRIEIAAALRRDIPVIPVLVRAARVPQPGQLPPEIADLAYRNGVELTHSRWKSDLQHLIAALEPIIGTPPPVEPIPQPALSPTPPLPPLPPAPAPIPPASLEKIARLLAHHIGPIADLVVRRSATRCANATELAEAVAYEIESPPARLKFLSECQRP